MANSLRPKLKFFLCHIEGELLLHPFLEVVEYHEIEEGAGEAYQHGDPLFVGEQKGEQKGGEEYHKGHQIA